MNPAPPVTSVLIAFAIPVSRVISLPDQRLSAALLSRTARAPVEWKNAGWPVVQFQSGPDPAGPDCNAGGTLELVKTLRELWRRKGLVALVLIASLLVGFFLAFRPGVPPKSRQYQVSLAISDILVDTSNSQVVAVGGRSPDLPTLAGRANLLGNLMTGGPLKNSIADRAGISPENLIVVPPANPNNPGVPPPAVTPLGEQKRARRRRNETDPLDG